MARLLDNEDNIWLVKIEEDLDIIVIAECENVEKEMCRRGTFAAE